jgi:hypothetical protein
MAVYIVKDFIGGKGTQCCFKVLSYNKETGRGKVQSSTTTFETDLSKDSLIKNRWRLTNTLPDDWEDKYA